MTELTYEVTDRQEDSVSLYLRGAMVGDRATDHVKRDLERHYVDDGVKVIRVDVGGLERLTLEGIGELLELWRESRERGKRFVIQGARGQVRDKLVQTGLLRPLERG